MKKSNMIIGDNKICMDALIGTRRKEELQEEIGYRILRLRIRRGYSREALARLTEISEKFLYEIETGRKSFTVGVLYRISKVLNVDCDYLLTGDCEKVIYNEALHARIKELDSEQIEKLIHLADLVYGQKEQY